MTIESLENVRKELVARIRPLKSRARTSPGQCEATWRFPNIIGEGYTSRILKACAARARFGDKYKVLSKCFPMWQRRRAHHELNFNDTDRLETEVRWVPMIYL